MNESILENANLSSILCRVVEEKLKASGSLELVRMARFGTNKLGLSANNSLLLEFQGPIQDTRFRMLVSFLLVDLLSLSVQNDVGASRDQLGFDLGVFWTINHFDTLESQALKRIGVHVLTVLPPEKVGIPYQQITDFVHVPNLDYGQVLEANLLGNEIVKRLRKKFHLVLSELAADTYDNYGTFATKEVMKFEDELLKEAIISLGELEADSIAIDVGCGNGRHSRTLAKYFQQVIAFDLSKKMLNAAREKDRKLRPFSSSTIEYYECDVEYEEFPNEDQFIGQVEFVCASFGMPSFVEDTASMLRRFYKWLRPNGRIFFTFYNANSLALSINPPWKERSLSAAIDLGRSALEVELREGVRFSIYCKPLDSSMLDMVKAYFSIEKVATFPHLLSLLPPSIFGSDEKPQLVAREVFSMIDRSVAMDSTIMGGHYVLMIAKKTDAPHDGYLRVLSMLRKLNVEYEILEHPPVVSTKEVQHHLSIDHTSMVKTVIFRSDPPGRYFIALVQPTQRVDLGKIANFVGLLKKEIILTPPSEIKDVFDLPIGGIPPLGFETFDNVQMFMDPALQDSLTPFVYMGIGDNTKTLKLQRQDFDSIVETYSRLSLTY